MVGGIPVTDAAISRFFTENLRFSTNTAPAERLRIDSSGNVGSVKAPQSPLKSGQGGVRCFGFVPEFLSPSSVWLTSYYNDGKIT